MGRLLVVDDEEAILFAMREYFTILGREVDCARSANEAAGLLRPGRYSAVIADLRLTWAGGTEGLDVVAWARERSPGTRIVLLTAYGSPAVEEQARRLGADVLLHKPQLLGEVARILAELEANSRA